MESARSDPPPKLPPGAELKEDMARIASRGQTLATIIVLEDSSQRPVIERVQPGHSNRFYRVKRASASAYCLFVRSVNHQRHLVKAGKRFGLVVADGRVGDGFGIALRS